MHNQANNHDAEMQEMLEDNAQFLEFRSVLPQLCPEMDGCSNNLTTEIGTATVFKQIADKFMADHPDDFCGIKLIYAPSRFVLTSTVDKYLDIAFELKSMFPDFVLGFDLVGKALTFMASQYVLEM